MRRLNPVLLLAFLAVTPTGATAARPASPAAPAGVVSGMVDPRGPAAIPAADALPAKSAEVSTRGPAVPLSDEQRAAIAAKHALVLARTPRPAESPAAASPKAAWFETVPPAGRSRAENVPLADVLIRPIGPGTPPTVLPGAPVNRTRDEAAAAAFRAWFGLDVARRAGLAKWGDTPKSTASASGGPR